MRTNRPHGCSRTSCGAIAVCSVAPKTVNQKRYVDSIRSSTVTFGVGPAGTGKTFLAVAMAAAALSRHEVNRIILTRPAVEAGERLGFLPGDLMAKVDPYLRPLFDALHDMLDPEKVSQHLERGVIEIAPLGVHARAHAQRLVRDPRRGAEHDARADEDVPDAARVRLEDGRHRRRHPGGSAARAAVGADRGGGGAGGGRGHRVRALRRRGRGASQARAAHRGGLRRAQPRARLPSCVRPSAGPESPRAMLEVEVFGAQLLADPAAALARWSACACWRWPPRACEHGHIAVEFVDAARIAELNAEHRGKHGPTDVLSFPIDGVAWRCHGLGRTRPTGRATSTGPRGDEMGDGAKRGRWASAWARACRASWATS